MSDHTLNDLVLSLTPSYRGCSVSEPFQEYQYFANWYSKQIGYGCKDYNFDKDLLLEGNKVYSEEVCVLIPKPLNMFVLTHEGRPGVLPVGVATSKYGGNFRANISVNNKSTYLGTFTTVEEARTAFVAAKNAEALRWYERLKSAEFVVDPRVIERMRTWVLVT